MGLLHIQEGFNSYTLDHSLAKLDGDEVGPACRHELLDFIFSNAGFAAGDLVSSLGMSAVKDAVQSSLEGAMEERHPDLSTLAA